jgi:hypothetical protein
MMLTEIDPTYCGPIDVHCEGWPKPKRFVIWNIAIVGSVKAALDEAAKRYEEIFGVRPQYAFIRKLPRGIESGVEVGNLLLFEAEWMVGKCIVVGWHYQ